METDKLVNRLALNINKSAKGGRLILTEHNQDFENDIESIDCCEGLSNIDSIGQHIGMGCFVNANDDELKNLMNKIFSKSELGIYGKAFIDLVTKAKEYSNKFLSKNNTKKESDYYAFKLNETLKLLSFFQCDVSEKSWF